VASTQLLCPEFPIDTPPRRRDAATPEIDPLDACSADDEMVDRARGDEEVAIDISDKISSC
jgi:hypothetical protein